MTPWRTVISYEEIGNLKRLFKLRIFPALLPCRCAGPELFEHYLQFLSRPRFFSPRLGDDLVTVFVDHDTRIPGREHVDKDILFFEEGLK